MQAERKVSPSLVEARAVSPVPKGGIRHPLDEGSEGRRHGPMTCSAAMKNTYFTSRSVIRNALAVIAVLSLFTGGAALASGKANGTCNNPQSHAKSCAPTTTTTTATT